MKLSELPDRVAWAMFIAPTTSGWIATSPSRRSRDPSRERFDARRQGGRTDQGADQRRRRRLGARMCRHAGGDAASDQSRSSLQDAGIPTVIWFAARTESAAESFPTQTLSSALGHTLHMDAPGPLRWLRLGCIDGAPVVLAGSLALAKMCLQEEHLLPCRIATRRFGICQQPADCFPRAKRDRRK